MQRCVAKLAEIVRQAEVIKSIAAAVKKEFDCPVYSDEVRESFKKPCFFIAASSRMTTQMVNWLNKELIIALTYYARDGEKNEITYMDVVDRVQLMYPVGIRAGGRFLHIDTIEDNRVGEEHDILQIEITIPYVEQVPNEKEVAPAADEVDVRIEAVNTAEKG